MSNVWTQVYLAADCQTAPCEAGATLEQGPVILQAAIGLLTVVGAFIAAKLGATRTQEATEQREKAASREEWFRRLQWAHSLTLSNDERSRSAGFAVLQALADSELATPEDEDLLWALNDNAALDEAEVDLASIFRAPVVDHGLAAWSPLSADSVSGV